MLAVPPLIVNPFLEIVTFVAFRFSTQINHVFDGGGLGNVRVRLLPFIVTSFPESPLTGVYPTVWAFTPPIVAPPPPEHVTSVALVPALSTGVHPLTKFNTDLWVTELPAFWTVVYAPTVNELPMAVFGNSTINASIVMTAATITRNGANGDLDVALAIFFIFSISVLPIRTGTRSIHSTRTPSRPRRPRD